MRGFPKSDILRVEIRVTVVYGRFIESDDKLSEVFDQV